MKNDVVYEKRMTQNCVVPFKECMRGKFVLMVTRETTNSYGDVLSKA